MCFHGNPNPPTIFQNKRRLLSHVKSVVWTRSDNRLTDLKEMHLQASMEGKSLGQAFGALIFTCNGRGRNLFNELSYDSRKIAEFIPVPSSGFLCNGKAMPIKASQQLCSGEQLSVSQNMKT